jgi:hydrogenase/urease accessory protein HupE
MTRWLLPFLHAVAGLLTTAVLVAALLGRPTEQALLAGLGHPLLDLDHFLALIVAGLWAGRLRRPAAWTLPLGFLAGMALGFRLAAPGPVLAVESILHLAMGVATVALALAAYHRLHPPMLDVSLALALLGICHGVTDRLEAGLAAAGPFAVGNLATATALLALGVVTGLVSESAD